MKGIRQYPIALDEVEYTFVEAPCETAPSGFTISTRDFAMLLPEAGFEKVSWEWLDETTPSAETWRVRWDGNQEETNQRLYDACAEFASAGRQPPENANHFTRRSTLPGAQEWKFELAIWPPDTVRLAPCQPVSKEVRRSMLCYDRDTNTCLGRLNTAFFKEGHWVLLKAPGAEQKHRAFFREQDQAVTFMRKAYSLGMICAPCVTARPC